MIDPYAADKNDFREVYGAINRRGRRVDIERMLPADHPQRLAGRMAMEVLVGDEMGRSHVLQHVTGADGVTTTTDVWLNSQGQVWANMSTDADPPGLRPRSRSGPACLGNFASILLDAHFIKFEDLAMAPLTDADAAGQ